MRRLNVQYILIEGDSELELLESWSVIVNKRRKITDWLTLVAPVQSSKLSVASREWLFYAIELADLKSCKP